MNQSRLSGQWCHLCILGLIIMLISVSCGGGDGSSPVTTTTYPRFAYVVNSNDGTISIYTVNADTGQLRHNGYVAAGTTPLSVTVDPSGRFAYAANFSSDNISVYAINQSTGALSPGTPVAAGDSPESVTTTGAIAALSGARRASVSCALFSPQRSGGETRHTPLSAAFSPERSEGENQ